MTLLYRNLNLGLKHSDPPRLQAVLERRLHLKRGAVRSLSIVRKSLDSRGGRRPRLLYSLAFDVTAPLERKLLLKKAPLVEPYLDPPKVRVPLVGKRGAAPRPVVIGAGPAGLFAAYRLAQAECPPIVIERGPEVTERSRRWHRFLTGGPFDPECNLLFGEGGAGAYSDGKLYTRVSDSRTSEVLSALVEFGAPREIAYDAKPHVGSNLLPSIVRRMRKSLIEQGVEFRFDTRMAELRLGGPAAGASNARRVTGIVTDPGGLLECDSVFLGTGHSARDTYRMLHAAGIAIEPKAFQIGVRVEHPQEFIDRLQYGEHAGHPSLPPAEYQLVAKRQAGDVFSFCMCPGGEILPATERAGFVCVNGASKYKRTSPYANSGFVITVDPPRFGAPGDPLAGLLFQENVEREAARAAAGGAATSSSGAPFAVPGARLSDFLAGRVSDSLPAGSYPFAVAPAPFDAFLPPFLLDALRDGFAILERRFPGFASDAALVVAPESRSSSPLRIVRDPVTLESPSAAGLYPMGEGAGFAGGILSAAIDGMRCAETWLARAAAAAAPLASCESGES
ncbi:MAG: hypothetical protein L0Z55_06510 [Planctomycetes bacterium]|nr:hypothetical protein [Planctomycetota bacterium]